MVGNRKEGLDAGKDGWTGTNGTAKTATIRAGSRVMAHTLHVEVWHLRGPNFFSQRIGKGHLRFGSMRGGFGMKHGIFQITCLFFLLCKYPG